LFSVELSQEEGYVKEKESYNSSKGRSSHGGWWIHGSHLQSIGGKECPRFAAMTWKEHAAFMKENEVVRSRYEAHMKSVR
jgi:hypothetical protein